MLTENFNTKTLHGKVILVTGASRGIGKEAALAFSRSGATVILCARNVKGLEVAYDQILAEALPEPAIFPLDLATAGPEQYEQLVEAIEKEFGKLDGILHNASILGSLTPIEHYKPAMWQEVIQVNLHAPFLLTQTCLPLLKEAHRASVVFTTSHFPERARAYWGAYAVAKNGLITLMQLLVEEMNHKGIYFNAINPGPVRTPMRCKAYPAEDKSNLLTARQLMPVYIKLMQAYRYQWNGQIIDGPKELNRIKNATMEIAETAVA